MNKSQVSNSLQNIQLNHIISRENQIFWSKFGQFKLNDFKKLISGEEGDTRLSDSSRIFSNIYLLLKNCVINTSRQSRILLGAFDFTIEKTGLFVQK